MSERSANDDRPDRHPVSRLRFLGVTFDRMARFLAGLTKAQTAKRGLTVPPGQAGQRVFDAVFAGSLPGRLPCD